MYTCNFKLENTQKPSHIHRLLMLLDKEKRTYKQVKQKFEQKKNNKDKNRLINLLRLHLRGNIPTYTRLLCFTLWLYRFMSWFCCVF